jgi:hypothetical protein
MELDGGAFIVDIETFRLVGELEIRKALRLQYPLALVVVKPGASLEEDGHRLLEGMARLIRALVRQSDLVAFASTRPAALYLLLVDALPGDLELITTRITHEMHLHRLVGPGVRINFGAASFPNTATTWPDLIREADRAARADA